MYARLLKELRTFSLSSEPQTIWGPKIVLRSKLYALRFDELSSIVGFWENMDGLRIAAPTSATLARAISTAAATPNAFSVVLMGP